MSVPSAGRRSPSPIIDMSPVIGVQVTLSQEHEEKADDTRSKIKPMLTSTTKSMHQHDQENEPAPIIEQQVKQTPATTTQAINDINALRSNSAHTIGQQPRLNM